MQSTPKVFKSKDSLALGFVVVVIVIYVILASYYPNHEITNQRLLFGGCIGLVCGIYVICRLQTDPSFQTPMLKLTFYRVLAELGISIRFIFSPYVNYELCGDYGGCDSIRDQSWNESVCAPWSGVLQFFLVASELWFLCTAFDFAVTLSNPFSPFNDRLKKYHCFCWGIALISALVVGCDSNLHGVWYADSEVASTTICWFKVDGGRLTDVNVEIWILFYAPLLVIYLYGIYVTVCAYYILSHGIQVTFLHRARVLFFSQLLLVVYICYWTCLLLLYMGIFISKEESLWHWMLFFIPARGVLGVFILFFTQFTSIFSEGDRDTDASSSSAQHNSGEFVDLNSALQNEIVAYATVGIKESALLTHKQSFVDSEHDDFSPLDYLAPTQNDFWIKIPPELVQLNSLKECAKAVDNDFKDIIKGYADTRSVAKLKHLLYQTPDNVQVDAKLFRESESRSTRSSRGSSLAPPSSTPSPGLTLLQLPKHANKERFSTTAPRPAGVDSNMSCWTAQTHRLQRFFTKCKAFLKRNSIILNSTPSSVRFTEYLPSIFYEVRMLYGMEGIYPESFEKPIKLHLAEGGASNALFFFSECRKFIAKSCTAQEMMTVRTHAGQLRDHFRENRSSLITRIFGAYKLQVYSTDLYFIVTNNVLQAVENESITEKFDLKGSSVSRHMKLPRDGETVRCRLCGSAFVYNSQNHIRSERESGNSVMSMPFHVNGSSSDVGNDVEGNRIAILTSVDGAGSVGSGWSTSASPTALERTMSRRVSRRFSSNHAAKKPLEQCVSDFSSICPLFQHVPDAVMKDNDFRGKAKIRLPPSVGDDLVKQLHTDCEFLANVYEVMDYSLLVGVYKKVIEIEADNTARTASVTRSAGGLNTRWKAGEFVVDYSYYMGIIDYQQPYHFQKKLEAWYKVHIGRHRPEDISCMAPGPYKDRFLNFMEDLLF